MCILINYRIKRVEQAIKGIQIRLKGLNQSALEQIYGNRNKLLNVERRPGEECEFPCPMCGYCLCGYRPELDKFCQRCGQRIQFEIQQKAWVEYPLKDEFDKY